MESRERKLWELLTTVQKNHIEDLIEKNRELDRQNLELERLIGRIAKKEELVLSIR